MVSVEAEYSMIKDSLYPKEITNNIKELLGSDYGKYKAVAYLDNIQIANKTSISVHTLKQVTNIIKSNFKPTKVKGFVEVDKTGYAINTKGVVLSPTGKILTKYVGKSGYIMCQLNTYSIYVHKELGKAFISNPNSKPLINHKDGNKLNYALSNLEWNTVKENTDHALSSGLQKTYGEQNGNAKLKNVDVISIRKSKLTAKELSIKYGVSTTQIRNIWNGKR